MSNECSPRPRLFLAVRPLINLLRSYPEIDLKSTFLMRYPKTQKPTITTSPPLFPKGRTFLLQVIYPKTWTIKIPLTTTFPHLPSSSITVRNSIKIKTDFNVIIEAKCPKALSASNPNQTKAHLSTKCTEKLQIPSSKAHLKGALPEWAKATNPFKTISWTSFIQEMPTINLNAGKIRTSRVSWKSRSLVTIKIN